jgi:hypothetical protein
MDDGSAVDPHLLAADEAVVEGEDMDDARGDLARVRKD